MWLSTIDEAEAGEVVDVTEPGDVADAGYKLDETAACGEDAVVGPPDTDNGGNMGLEDEILVGK